MPSSTQAGLDPAATLFPRFRRWCTQIALPSIKNADSPAPAEKLHLRFHIDSHQLASAFGGDNFGKKTESFARFFGTPTFLNSQTVVVGVWIFHNAAGIIRFDLDPFILLNLAFSLLAAYAAHGVSVGIKPA